MNLKPRITRIMIVHDQAMFREGLKLLLEAEPDMQVVADTGDCDQVVELALKLKPDIVMMDITQLQSQSNGTGMQVLRQLDSMSQPVPVILMNADINKSQTLEAMKLGVKGVLPNKSGISLYLKCIRSVIEGQYWVSRNATSELIENLMLLNTRLEKETKVPSCNFSKRELQVLRAIVYGYSNKDIADELSISEQAVKYHLTHIFRKVGVSGRMALARYTIDHQLIREA